MQVKSQSDELSSGYAQLQQAQAEVEEQRRQLKEQAAASEAETKAAKAAQAAAEASAQQAAEAKLAAATEQRKLGQERLESLRAVEATREMQLRLAALLQAAVAAQVPRAADILQQLGAEMGAAGGPGWQGGAELADAGLQRLAAAPVPMQRAAPTGPAQPRPGSAPMVSIAAVPMPAFAPHGTAASPVGAGGSPPGDEGGRYRALLADLEGSISRWRGQLRAGEPLTLDTRPGLAGSLGVASFYMPALCDDRPAVAAGPTAKAGGCGARPAGASTRQQRRRPKPVQPGAEEEEEEEAPASSSDAEGETEQAQPGARRPGSASQCSAVQTTVSYIDAPRAFVEGGSCQRSGGGSVPCSPAKQRSGGPEPASSRRPASAGLAEHASMSGAASQGGPIAIGSPRDKCLPGKHWAAGRVRAVRSEAPGLTIPAEYSLPGSSSPQHPKQRKWLKFKSGGGAGREAEATAAAPLSSGRGCEGGSGAGWGGIFSFRRSVDGGASQRP